MFRIETIALLGRLMESWTALFGSDACRMAFRCQPIAGGLGRAFGMARTDLFFVRCEVFENIL